MNQRIKLLAVEAGLYVDLKGKPWPRAMSAEECEVAYKKFAELIVRECVDICKHDSADDDDQFDLGRVHQAKLITQLIKIHFGVG